MKRAISIFCAIALTLAAGTSALSQSPTPATRKNFAYSQNPKTKPHPEGQSTTPNPTPAPVADAVPASTPQIARNEPSIANKTREVALKAAKTSAAPTETYVIGNGDAGWPQRTLFLRRGHSAKTNSGKKYSVSWQSTDRPRSDKRPSPIGATGIGRRGAKKRVRA